MSISRLFSKLIKTLINLHQLHNVKKRVHLHFLFILSRVRDIIDPFFLYCKIKWTIRDNLPVDLLWILYQNKCAWTKLVVFPFNLWHSSETLPLSRCFHRDWNQFYSQHLHWWHISILTSNINCLTWHLLTCSHVKTIKMSFVFWISNSSLINKTWKHLWPNVEVELGGSM